MSYQTDNDGMMAAVCAILQTHMRQMCYEIEQYRTTCEKNAFLK